MEISKALKWIFTNCLLVFNAVTVDGAFKKWVPNTNFDNPSNWNAGRLPCKNDAVKFPETIPPVYIQMNATVQEIVLPMNGELILSNYMSLNFPKQPDKDSSCVGQDIAYVGGTPHSWFSPDSWCEVADPEGTCMSEPPARLDTERVPCETDTVIFAKDSSYAVDLQSGVDVYLGKLMYQGQEYTTGSFRSYIMSTEGRRVFQRSGGQAATSVNIRGSGCADITGCPCGNDGGLLEQKVCELTQVQCKDLLCVKPLLPEGHCCHICGTTMLLTYGPGFKYKSIEGAVLGSIPRDMRSSVRVIVSRTSSEHVQIVIEDIDGSGRTGELANSISEKVKKDPVTGISRYRINQVQVSSSDSTTSQAQRAAGKWGGGSIASLVIAIIVILVIALVAMYCLIERRRNPNNNRPKLHFPSVPWRFNRFGRDDDRSGLELGPSLAFKDNISFYNRGQGADSLRGFDNPTYGQAGQGQMNGHSDGTTVGGGISTIDLNEPTFVKSGDNTGFSNPLYADTKIENLTFSGINMNPVFSAEGLEEDSEI